MCGIAGYFGKRCITDAQINKTLELMKRRGPDGQKYRKIPVSEDNFCHLLHSRLSIIDLDDRSSQPFHYKGKTLVFNGEIYNYIEIKEELEKYGHQFTTQSDTEVLIHALDEWGIDALNKCEGMWAFALYNDKTKVLTLSRDPFGEKPLYIYEPAPGEIYFASEIKFISSLSGIKFPIDLNHISRFLANGYKSLFKTQSTFFKDIYHFPSAHSQDITIENRTAPKPYWQISLSDTLDVSFEEASAYIRNFLIKTVEKKLRSDVPLAFCLSGGVDSTSLISIATKELGYNVHGFSILSKDEKYDEKEDILKTVSELSIPNTAIEPQIGSFFQNIEDITLCHDGPPATLTYYMNWHLYKKMSDAGFSVAIMGTGGDEIFSGYYDHHNFYLADLKSKKEYGEALSNWKQHIRGVVRNPYLSDPDIFYKNPKMRDHIYLNDLSSKLLKDSFDESFEEKHYHTAAMLPNRMLNELFYETVPVSLNQDDLNCMHYSIENRSPMLSRHLVEFVQKLPIQYYIRDGYGKALLRSAMKGITPKHVLTRRKKLGLNTSIRCLANFNSMTFQDKILADSPIYEIVQKEYVEELIKEKNIKNSQSKFLFSLLGCKVFMENYG